MRKLGFAAALLAMPVATAAAPAPAPETLPWLSVSAEGRYLRADGKPFFWLGDTGWLMLSRLNREETEHYLAKRAAQGFNVIQVMVLHSPEMTSRYGAPALDGGDPAHPHVTPGRDPARPGEYDFWDHLDWAVDRAAAHGLYLALVPSWGSLASSGKLNPASAEVYGRFLAERYGDKSNIVWLNGGDTLGNENTETWQALGRTIKAADPRHLMTFHPFGRTDSSWTFHRAPWLDFNMFQSGHRTYDQEDPGARSEDNWRFVTEDLALSPPKPTIDGEPSYENIPHGLHDTTQPRWGAADARRYAWWAVFAGAMGHSYGENSVMQMYVPGRDKPAYGAELRWEEALDAPAAGQMRHLKRLMLSRPYFERVPDQSLILDNGVRYDRVLATRGRDYMMAYSYTGRPFRVRLGAIEGRRVRAAWYSPRTGETQAIGNFDNRGERRFVPPGTPAPGNDWVLLLDDSTTGRTP
ncbi:collagenase-like protein with putative collagen-binding domain [Hephaestia caeni]|uniref:Collagenase-like protein with putative collagen-binding domain n=1 Tax=Hephaestia caeni TaxID=645617 RepID=A0A397P9F2_9SPHN|nr:glycoside hydrolase family 140 protein [Hephaestia caeni]RIA43795.1 collagenase-like protein with putative collagen-binding domain [Hephaestia caeni]